MPIIKSAKKKLKQDIKRHKANLIQKRKTLKAISDFRKKPTGGGLDKLFKTLDTASKKHIFHHKKVDRLKSRLSKMVPKTKRAS